MPTTKPDPAAVEAARKIQALCGWGERMTEDFATIIESSTHVGELREALRNLVRASYGHDEPNALRKAESVLAKLSKD